MSEREGRASIYCDPCSAGTLPHGKLTLRFQGAPGKEDSAIVKHQAPIGGPIHARFAAQNLLLSPIAMSPMAMAGGEWREQINVQYR